MCVSLMHVSHVLCVLCVDVKSEAKMSVTNLNIENEEAHKQMESRMNTHLKNIQKELEGSISDQKSSIHKLQDKIDEVHYEMKYAIDQQFAKGLNTATPPS